MFGRLKAWYGKQTSTTQGLLWVGILLLIGVLLRWDYIVEEVRAGFDFLNNK